MQTFPCGLGQRRVCADNVAEQIRWAEDFWRGLTPTVCANK
jgi:hypothetical protein